MTLCHLDDLVRWLSLTRARHLVRNRQDAFATLPAERRQELPVSAAKAGVSALLKATRPEEAMAALHDFIERRVAATSDGGEPMLAPQGKLRDYLCYHVFEEGKEELAQRLQELLPEEIRIGQAVELFVAMARKDLE